MLDFQDPQVWWFLTRASAMVAWVLLTLTAVWGILLKTRILRGADNPEWLTVTHRYISGLAMAMIATHMGTLLLDEYIQFGWTDILVPFATTFRTLAGGIRHHRLLAHHPGPAHGTWLKVVT